MKQSYRQSLRLLIAVVIVTGAWVITPVAPVGCAYVNPTGITQANTDQIILRAEQTAETAKLTFNTLLHLERDNEAGLKAINPQIHVWANTLRAHGIDWIQSLRTATKDFKANRNAQNQATLNTALTTLTNAINTTNAYITQAKRT